MTVLKPAAVRCAFVAFLLLFTGVLQAGQYFQDFSGSSVGDTNFNDGSQLVSTSLGTVAAVTDATYKELKLTASSGSGVVSAFVLPDLDPGAPIYAFSAKWNAPIYGGFPNAADGYSFNFGQLRNVNLTGTNVESGYGVGLCFAVQNYSSPGFYLRFNGTNLASKTYTPLTQWGSFNSKRHLFEVDWNFVAGMNVRVDGQLIFTNVPTTGFFPKSADCFVWAARTGGLLEDVRLDNIVVKTGGNLIPVSVTAPYYGDTNTDGTLTANKAFDGVLTTDWQTHAKNGYVGGTLSTATPIVAFGITSGATAANDPQTWTLDGSNNQGTNWTPCATNSTAFINRQETRMFATSNGSSFSAYRINVITNSGGLATDIGDLQFFGFTSFTPSIPTIDATQITTSTTNSVDFSIGVTPHSLATAVDVQFGPTTNYGTDFTYDIGTDGVNCVATINNLNIGTVYHLRTIASNALGAVTNADIPFAITSFSLQSLTNVPGTYAGSVAAGDYDNDGRMDFAMMGVDGSQNYYCLVYHNTGTNFTLLPIVFPPVQDGTVAWVDTDRDGFLDFFVLGDQATQLFKNNNGTNFTYVASFATMNGGNAASWGDYDNDGYPDLLVAGGIGSDPRTLLYHNNFGTNYTAVTVPGLDGALGGSAWGDYDNDGKLDFIIYGSECVRLFHNDGGGTFHQVVLPGLASSPDGLNDRGSVAWADYDKDGFLDFVITGKQNGLPTSQLWRGQGGTNFTQVTVSGLTGVNAGNVCWGDYDNDGNLDFLMVGSRDYTIFPGQIFHSDGQGNFVETIPQNMPQTFLPNATFADLDNDGDLDFLLNNYSQFAIGKNGTINLGSNPATNIPPTAPTGLVATATGTRVALRWNRATDNATPTLGLSYNFRIGTTPGGYNIVTAHALTNGFRQLVGLGNAMQRTNAQILNLLAGTYYWSVQAIDASWAGGPFATEGSFVVPGLAPTLASQFFIGAGAHAGAVGCSIIPGGLPTTVWIQFGLSSTYTQTNLVSIDAPSLVLVTNTTVLPSLLAQTTYHYRFVISNAVGVVNGTDQTFSTTGDISIFDISAPNDPTVASSTNFAVSTPSMFAIDDTLATKYLNFDKLNTGLTIYPSGTNVVRALTLFSATDASERDPASFVLSGSFDGVNFVQIASNGVPGFAARSTLQVFSFTNNVAYPVYNLTFPTVQNPSSANSMQIAEVELLPYADVTSPADSTTVTLPTGAVLVSSGGALLDHRLDGNGNKLELKQMSNDVSIVITPTSGLSVPKALELIGGNDDGIVSPSREPSKVILEGSIDGTNYTLITSFVPNTLVTNMQIQQVSFSTNTTAYTQYRVTISKPATNDWMQVGEARVLGIIVPSRPLALTLAASSPTADAITLAQTIYPHAADTTAWFEYGLTTSYGQTSVPQSAGNGTSTVSLNSRVTGLRPNTAYHYRAAAANAVGTNYGVDLTFTTPDTFNLAIVGDPIFATSTNSPSGQAVANAISSSGNDRYGNSDITNTGFTIFPGVTNVPVQAIGLFCSSDPQANNPASFILSGSNDGTNFTMLASNTVPAFPSLQSLESISFPNTNLYSVYKVIFPTVQNPATATAMQVAEVQLLPFGDITTSNDLVAVTLPPGATTSTESALVDRRYANQFIVNGVTTNITVTITPVVRSSIVKGFELVAGSFGTRGPSAITLEGSTDGINFFILSTLSALGTTGRYQIQDFSIATNTTTCMQYRVTFGKPTVGTTLTVGEFRLFGISQAPVLNVHALPGQGTLYFNLQWPIAPDGYILESATDLKTPLWQPVPGTPYTNGNAASVMLEQTGTNQFFRLHKP